MLTFWCFLDTSSASATPATQRLHVAFWMMRAADTHTHTHTRGRRGERGGEKHTGGGGGGGGGGAATDTDTDTDTDTHHPKDNGSSCADEENLHQRIVERNEAEKQVLPYTDARISNAVMQRAFSTAYSKL